MRVLCVSIAIGFVVGGCHKEGGMAPGSPPSTAEVDALWKLAPDDTMVAVVVSPRANAFIEHAVQDIHAFVAAVPAFAPSLAEPEGKLKELTGSSDVSFAALGLSTH